MNCSFLPDTKLNYVKRVFILIYAVHILHGYILKNTLPTIVVFIFLLKLKKMMDEKKY